MRSRAAIIATALLEMAVGATLWVIWFLAFRREYYAATAEGDVLFAYGALMFLSFMVSLRGLVAGFLVAEGALRPIHAVFTEEPIGFLIPTLARAAARRWRAWRHPPPADRVVRQGDGSVTVLGMRRDWHAFTTFVIDGELYTLAAAVPVGALVRYTLRPAPEHHLVRNLVRVDVGGEP